MARRNRSSSRSSASSPPAPSRSRCEACRASTCRASSAPRNDTQTALASKDNRSINRKTIQVEPLVELLSDRRSWVRQVATRFRRLLKRRAKHPRVSSELGAACPRRRPGGLCPGADGGCCTRRSRARDRQRHVSRSGRAHPARRHGNRGPGLARCAVAARADGHRRSTGRDTRPLRNPVARPGPPAQSRTNAPRPAPAG